MLRYVPDEQFRLERSTYHSANGGIGLLMPYHVLNAFYDDGAENYSD